MALSRRAEVLFTQGEFDELKREATRRGVSFGELIREAVRKLYLQPSAERRKKALEFFTSGPVVDVGTWEDAKKLIGRWVDKEP